MMKRLLVIGIVVVSVILATIWQWVFAPIGQLITQPLTQTTTNPHEEISFWWIVAIGGLIIVWVSRKWLWTHRNTLGSVGPLMKWLGVILLSGGAIYAAFHFLPAFGPMWSGFAVGAWEWTRDGIVGVVTKTWTWVFTHKLLLATMGFFVLILWEKTRWIGAGLGLVSIIGYIIVAVSKDVATTSVARSAALAVQATHGSTRTPVVNGETSRKITLNHDEWFEVPAKSGYIISCRPKGRHRILLGDGQMFFCDMQETITITNKTGAKIYYSSAEGEPIEADLIHRPIR